MASSWVVINRHTGEVIVELRLENLVKKLNISKYKAIPIKKYLHYVNVGIAIAQVIKLTN
jgi:hypothetical protein